MVQKQIIIAGGGFGGVRAALDLSRKLPHAQILLINDTPYHSFHADLYELAGAILPKERKIDFTHLEGTVNIRLADIFRNTNVSLAIQHITSIDITKKELQTTTDSYQYEYIVLALGSFTSYLHVTGSENFGHPFKTTTDALNIRNDIEELIRTNDTPQSIVIAGGGFTGVELAGSLSHFLEALSRTYRKPKPTLTLIGSRPSVLDGMPPWAQEHAEKRLRQLGVSLLLKHRIASIDEVKVTCVDGDTVPYDYVLWTTGVKGNTLGGGINGIAFTDRGQIATTPELHVVNHEEVFVVGDLISCMDHKNGCPVASTAHAAIDQGRVAAENIARLLGSQRPVSYIPKSPHFAVPIGRKYGISDMYHLSLRGVSGWCIKRLISLRYFWSILPPLYAMRLWMTGVRTFRAND